MKNLKKIAILASIYKALHKIEVQNSGDLKAPTITELNKLLSSIKYSNIICD